MDEDEGSRGEEDRGKYLIAELPMLQEVWLGIPRLCGSTTSRSILVGRMMATLEVEVVDEEEGVEQEDEEDLLRPLREEGDLMVMRRYSNLREVEPVKHLRIEHRRPRRQA